MKYLLPTCDDPFSRSYPLGPIRYKILPIEKVPIYSKYIGFTGFYSEINIVNGFLTQCLLTQEVCLFEVFMRNPVFSPQPTNLAKGYCYPSFRLSVHLSVRPSVNI